MIVKKIHFVIDNTNKAKSFRKKFYRTYKNYHPKTSDVIVVLGGDGFMLQTLKKYQKYDKPFYGLNRGTFGFLMNKFKSQNIKKNISRSKLVSISPLEAKITTTKNKIQSAFAINEVSLLRQSRQTASLRISSSKKVIIKKLISDGVIISTPAGSTAYNLSARGQIIPINSKLLALTPISPFRPRGWRGALINSKSKVTFIILDEKKRSVNVSADFKEIKDIKKVEVREDRTVRLSLLFDPDHNFDKKVLKEQFSF